MFTREGPKFVQIVGVQILCPYCHKKFKAPQGLVSHKHMHERAGHVVSKLKKHDAKRPLEQPFLLRRVQNEFDKPEACQIVNAPVCLSQKEGWGFFLKLVKKIEATSKKKPHPPGGFPAVPL